MVEERGTSVSKPLLGRLTARGWGDDPLWASVYDWSVEHPRVGGAGWAVAVQSDLRLLYSAAAEIGGLPAGSRVLDVPCGGGVALRGLQPAQGITYVAADISPAMLERTRAAAERRGVLDQVELVVADVGALPDGPASYDLVVSFTGLHCFPDPQLAVAEMCRVLRPGGVLTASWIANDTGLRFEPMRRGGRLAGLLGPGATRGDVRRWLTTGGLTDVTVETSGAIAYVRGRRSG